MTAADRMKNQLPPQVQNLQERESYASLAKQNKGEKAQIGEAIQNRIDKVLDNQSKAPPQHMAGKISAKQVLKGQHPDVDMSKLTPIQRAEVHRMITHVKNLQKEGIALKK